MKKNTVSIFDESFEQVAFLYAQKLAIEKSNNIAARTRLLRSYPELFDDTIFSEIESVIKLAQKTTKIIHDNDKLIHFDFKKRKKAKMFDLLRV